MAQNANNTCLYTKVRNISGKKRTFGYLGMYGKTLDVNETFLHPGNLSDQLAALKSNRKFNALKKSLDDNGSLEILSTPAVHLYDDGKDEVKVLSIHNGVLGHTDPCWESDGSSDFVH